MKLTKKIVSSLLAVLLVVALLPMSFTVDAYAESGGGNPTVILAGSDFQATTDELSASNVNGILTRIKRDYASADGFIFSGDLDASDKKEDVVLGSSQVHDAVAGVYGEGLDEYYVQGNHDNKKVMKSGVYEKEDYSVFMINYDDCNWRDNYNTALFQQLQSFLNAKADEDYAKPIFVTAHTPLHYSTRNDVKHAKVIFDILNEAGGRGLNVIYLFGHNHSGAYDSYLGGGSIYLPAGSEICVQNGKDNYTRETLNFTYMNAGYVGYVKPANPDTALTMSVFVIEDDQVTVRRYDQNGEHALKAAGVKLTNDFDGCVADTSVVPSGQIIRAQYGEMLVDEATGVKVKTADGAALTVTPVTLDNAILQQVNSNGNYRCYDIAGAGYTDSEKAKVYLPVGNLDNPLSVYRIGAEGLERMPAQIKDGYAVFVANRLGRYLLTTADTTDELNWVQIPGEGSYVYTRIASNDKELDGKAVMIVRGSNAMAINDGNFVPCAVSVSGDTLTANTNADEWVFEKIAEDTYHLRHADQYLRNNNGALQMADAPNRFDDTYAWNDVFGGGSRYLKNASSKTHLSIEPAAVSLGTKHTVTLFGYNPAWSTVTAGGYAALDAEDMTICVGDYTSGANVLADAKNRIRVVYKDDISSTDIEEVTSGVTFTGTVDPSRFGKYTVAVQYMGQTLGNIAIHVVEKSVTSVALIPGQTRGEVDQNSAMNIATGDKLHVVYSNGSEVDVAITVGMLSGNNFGVNAAGIYENLTVTFDGKSVTGYTLQVLPDVPDVPDVPDMPDVPAQEVTYYYTLDTDGIDRGAHYLIVADSKPIALHGTGREDVAISGNIISTNTNAWEWIFTDLGTGDAVSIAQNGQYLAHGASRGDGMAVGSEAVAWTITPGSAGTGKYRIRGGSLSVRYSASKSAFQYESGSGSGTYVRLYKLTGMEVTQAN